MREIYVCIFSAVVEFFFAGIQGRFKGKIKKQRGFVSSSPCCLGCMWEEIKMRAKLFVDAQLLAQKTELKV